MDDYFKGFLPASLAYCQQYGPLSNRGIFPMQERGAVKQLTCVGLAGPP
jgi:hypothetical protein